MHPDDELASLRRLLDALENGIDEAFAKQ